MKVPATPAAGSDNPIDRIVPEAMLKQYAFAAMDARFSAVIVLSDEILAALKENKPALLDGPPAMALLFIPQALAEQAYPPEKGGR